MPPKSGETEKTAAETVDLPASSVAMPAGQPHPSAISVPVRDVSPGMEELSPGVVGLPGYIGPETSFGSIGDDEVSSNPSSNPNPTGDAINSTREQHENRV